MGYLGLSEPIEKEDNLFKRLFWPADHAGEADSLGQQGFWICAFVAIASALMFLVQGHPIIAIICFAFFVLGGIGIREHSTPAAALVAFAYILDRLAGLFTGRPPGWGAIIITVLLIANIRGTWIASKWVAKGDPDAIPERMNETWRDRLVDQMPARVWPKARIVFFCVAGVYLSLLLVGSIILAKHIDHAATPAPSQSMQLDVAPPK